MSNQSERASQPGLRSFLFALTQHQDRTLNLAEHHYAIDDKEKSNISYREAESALLSELGFPQHPHELKYGDAHVLMDYLMKHSRVMLDERTIHAVRTQGYKWRRDVPDVNPETALYLDAYARLNEIYDAHEAHESASRVSNLKAILGRMD